MGYSCAVQKLRTDQLLGHALARWMLLWFVLAVGAAIASPMVNPQTAQLICSGTGAMKIIVFTDDGAKEVAATHTLDCPLCAGLGGPLPVIRWATEPAQPLDLALRSIPAARMATLTAPPPPARGPPEDSH
jgi:hypothetical protein